MFSAWCRDRHIDKDIGNVEGQVLPEPTMAGYNFPDPTDHRYFADIPEKLENYPDRFRVFDVGFSLYERAWAMRGMEPLLMDFVENPDFVHELMDRICDYNIAHVTKALEYDIDAVHFGDDWGSQHGLIMGRRLWKKFIEPRLKRMYDVVLAAGKFVSIHSCGDVDELFDPLVDIGLSCFNPFQPEVMDVYELLPRYRGRLSFHGGLSTQKTLPFGSVDDVRRESKRLLELGSQGGYIFLPRTPWSRMCRWKICLPSSTRPGGSPATNRFTPVNKFSYRVLGGLIFDPIAWNAAQFASISAAFAGVIIPGG